MSFPFFLYLINFPAFISLPKVVFDQAIFLFVVRFKGYSRHICQFSHCGLKMPRVFGLLDDFLGIFFTIFFTESLPAFFLLLPH